MAETGSSVSAALQKKKEECTDHIKQQMKSRGYRAAIKLRNASQIVLRGQRSGRMYNVPGTGKVTYYKRNTQAIGLEYHRRNSKNHKAGTASFIYKHKRGTATITYKKYRASAPGEPPAVRTGAFRLGWKERSYAVDEGRQLAVHSIIENRVRTDNNKYLLGDVLEDGTRRMAPRPYKDRIKEKAKKEIKKIYQAPYF